MELAQPGSAWLGLAGKQVSLVQTAAPLARLRQNQESFPQRVSGQLKKLSVRDSKQVDVFAIFPKRQEDTEPPPNPSPPDVVPGSNLISY